MKPQSSERESSERESHCLRKLRIIDNRVVSADRAEVPEAGSLGDSATKLELPHEREASDVAAQALIQMRRSATRSHVDGVGRAEDKTVSFEPEAGILPGTRMQPASSKELSVVTGSLLTGKLDPSRVWLHFAAWQSCRGRMFSTPPRRSEPWPPSPPGSEVVMRSVVLSFTIIGSMLLLVSACGSDASDQGEDLGGAAGLAGSAGSSIPQSHSASGGRVLADAGASGMEDEGSSDSAGAGGLGGQGGDSGGDETPSAGASGSEGTEPMGGAAGGPDAGQGGALAGVSGSTESVAGAGAIPSGGSSGSASVPTAGNAGSGSGAAGGVPAAGGGHQHGTGGSVQGGASGASFAGGAGTAESGGQATNGGDTGSAGAAGDAADPGGGHGNPHVAGSAGAVDSECPQEAPQSGSQCAVSPGVVCAYEEVDCSCSGSGIWRC